MATNLNYRLYWLDIAIAEVGTQAALASLVGSSEAYISQMKTGAPDSKTGKPRGIGSKFARRVEDALKKPSGWMDQPPPKNQADPELGRLIEMTYHRLDSGLVSPRDLSMLKAVLQQVNEPDGIYDVTPAPKPRN